MSLQISDRADIKVIAAKDNSMYLYLRDTQDKSNAVNILMTDNIIKELLSQIGEVFEKRNERRF